jgi:integrase
MADIDDRWYRTDKATGKRVPTARHGKGRRWDVRYRDESQPPQQRHKAFERKQDAERFLAKTTTDLAHGAYVSPASGKVTVKTYAESWRLAQVHRPTSRAHVETMLRGHVYPTFGDRALASIRTSEVQAWVRGLEDHLAPATIQIVYSFLASMFRAAVLDRLIAVSPCVRIALPAVAPKEIEPLETGKVEALIGAIPQRYRALLVLLAGSGPRQGEAFGLELGHVDFLRRTLKVEQQLVTVPGKPPYLAPPKTRASYRTIPLPQVVVDALAAHLAAFPAVSTEVLDTTVKPAPKLRTARLLFLDDRGEPIRRTRFSEAWRPAARAAGLGDDVTGHDLRHYYASLLIAHNESVKVVQKRLGHKSAVETLDTYANLWPDTEDQTRAAVDSVLMCATRAPSERAGGETAGQRG